MGKHVKIYPRNDNVLSVMGLNGKSLIFNVTAAPLALAPIPTLPDMADFFSFRIGNMFRKISSKDLT